MTIIQYDEVILVLGSLRLDFFWYVFRCAMVWIGFSSLGTSRCSERTGRNAHSGTYVLAQSFFR